MSDDTRTHDREAYLRRRQEMRVKRADVAVEIIRAAAELGSDDEEWRKGQIDPLLLQKAQDYLRRFLT